MIFVIVIVLIVTVSFGSLFMIGFLTLSNLNHLLTLIMNCLIFSNQFIKVIYKILFFILLFIICFRTLLQNKNTISISFHACSDLHVESLFSFLFKFTPCGSSTGSSPPSNHSDSWIKTPKSSSLVLMTQVKQLFFFVSNKTSWSKWILPNNRMLKNLSWEKSDSKPGILEGTKLQEKHGEITFLMWMASFT